MVSCTTYSPHINIPLSLINILKMRIFYIITILSAILQTDGNSQRIEHEALFGDSDKQEFVNQCFLNDENQLLVAGIRIVDNIQLDVFLTEIDLLEYSENIIRTTNIGADFRFLYQKSNGNYLYILYYYDQSTSAFTNTLIELDVDGTEISTIDLNLSNEMIEKAILDFNHNLYILSSSINFPVSRSSFLRKYVDGGTLVWENSSQKDSTQYVHCCVDSTFDAGIVVGGFVKSENGEGSYHIKKVNQDGGNEWEIDSQIQNSSTIGLFELNSRAIIHISKSSDVDTIYLSKFNSQGQLVWEKSIDEKINNNLRPIILKNSNEEVVIIYYSNSSLFVTTISSVTGEILQTSNLTPTTDIRWITQAKYLDDNNLILIGATRDDDYFIIKLTDLLTSSITESSTLLGDVEVFPNPCSNICEIEFINSEHINKISIYSLAGDLIRELQIKDHVELTVENISPGLYFLKVQYYSGKTVSKKIVINNYR